MRFLEMWETILLQPSHFLAKIRLTIWLMKRLKKFSVDQIKLDSCKLLLSNLLLTEVIEKVGNLTSLRKHFIAVVPIHAVTLCRFWKLLLPWLLVYCVFHYSSVLYII